VKTGKHFERVYGGTRPAGIIKSQKQPLLLTPRTNLLSAGTRFVVQWPSTRPPSTESWRRTLVTTVFLPFPHVLHHPRPRYVIVLVYSVICGFYYLRLLFTLSRTARSRDAHYPTALGLTSIQIRRNENVDVWRAVSADKL